MGLFPREAAMSAIHAVVDCNEQNEYCRTIQELAKAISRNRSGLFRVDVKLVDQHLTVGIRGADVWLIGYLRDLAWCCFKDCTIGEPGAECISLGFEGSYHALGIHNDYQFKHGTLLDARNLPRLNLNDWNLKPYLAHLVIAVSEAVRFELVEIAVAGSIDSTSFRLGEIAMENPKRRTFYDLTHDWSRSGEDARIAPPPNVRKS